MSDKSGDVFKQYIIPENFIDSGRIFNGMFKTRNFIEGVVLGTVFGLIAFALPISDFSVRLPCIILIFATMFFIGYHGYNEDPLSESVKYVYEWYKTKGVILYNGNTRFYEESPLDAALAEEDIRDKIVDILEKRQLAKIEADKNKRFVEGVDFEFADDEDRMARTVSPNYQKQTSDGFEDDLDIGEEDFEEILLADFDNIAEPTTLDVIEAAPITPVIPTIAIPDLPRQIDKPMKADAVESVPKVKMRNDLKALDEGDLF